MSTVNVLLLPTKRSAGETGNRLRAKLHEASLYLGLMMVNRRAEQHIEEFSLLFVPAHLLPPSLPSEEKALMLTIPAPSS